MFAAISDATFHVKRFAFSGKRPQLLAFKAKMFHVKRFAGAIKFRRKEYETICLHGGTITVTLAFASRVSSSSCTLFIAARIRSKAEVTVGLIKFVVLGDSFGQSLDLQRILLGDHGLGHGAGICPVDPMTLMIAPALPPGWLTGMGFPPGSGVGPMVCTAPYTMSSPAETIKGAD
jgi:hypothetical protein